MFNKRLTVTSELAVTYDTIFSMDEWNNAGAELPEPWILALNDLALSLRNGKRGLQKYMWCVAAERLLKMPRAALVDEANKMRLAADSDWQAFCNRFDSLAETLAAAVQAKQKAEPRRREARRKSSGAGG